MHVICLYRHKPQMAVSILSTTPELYGTSIKHGNRGCNFGETVEDG